MRIFGGNMNRRVGKERLDYDGEQRRNYRLEGGIDHRDTNI